MDKCPKCGRYGIEWDARAKVFRCYYTDCNYVIRNEEKDEMLKMLQKSH